MSAAFWRTGSRWLVAAGLSALAVVAVLAYERQTQRQRAAADASALLTIKQATEDLDLGLMHVVLDNGGDTPWQRAQGLALVRQAAAALATSVVDPGPEAEAQARARGGIAALADGLAAPGQQDPGRDPQIRLAMHAVHRELRTVETALQRREQQHQEQAEQQFARMLAVSALMLAAVGAGAVHSERQRARGLAELAGRDARLRQTLGSLFEGVVTVDAEGMPIDANPAAERILGLSLAQMQARRARGLPWLAFHPDGRPMVPGHLPHERALASGEPQLGCEVGIGPEGEGRRWLEINAEPLRDPALGRLQGVTVSFHDVTSERGALRRLSEAQQHLEGLVQERTQALASALAAHRDSVNFAQIITDHQPTLLAYWDRDFRLRFANRAYLQWFGLDREAVLGRTVAEVLGPQMFQQRKTSMDQVLSGEPIHEDHHALTGADGRTGMFQVFRLPDWRDDGVQGYFYIATNITEVTDARQRAERLNDELRQASHLLRTVADTLPAHVAYWDRDGRCRFANRALCGWMGVAADRVVGRRDVDLMPPARLALDAHYRAAALAGVPQAFQSRAIGADGVAADWSVHFMPDIGDGEVLGYTVLAVDQSQERDVERRLRELNDAMAAARDRAEAATRAKSAFLANMSHEIRTPLNAIIGLTHLMRQGDRSAPAPERLDKVAGAAQHLLQLVNDVLDLSKIEAGQLQLEQAAFSPDEVVARVVDLIAPAARDKGLTLAVQAEGLPAPVWGDRTRLSQVLLNLLGNAVKFTASGHVCLRAAVLPADGQGRQMLRFEVEDSGIGVAPEALARLFQPFAQADDSTSRRFGGTGLGLSIVRELSRLMHGEAGATSTPGQGSCFWFTAWLPPVPGAQATVVPLAASPDRLRGRRVLLAEDNPVNQEVASSLLETVGVEVQVVDDGHEAVAAARQGGFDAILMDMQMPGLDGLDATRAIRAEAAAAEAAGAPRVPIIAMTANAFADDRQRCLAAGMDDHITKPVDPDALFGALLRWCR